MNKDQLKITVVVVARDRLVQIQSCIHSLHLAVEAAKNLKIQIRIVLNQPTESVRKFIETNFDSNLIYNTHRLEYPGAARNVALKKLDSDWIFFIDDDASIERDFFLKAEKYLNDPSVYYIGGPNLTPPRSSTFAAATESVLANSLITWTISRRYSSKKGQVENGSEPKMILCNFFVRAQVCEIYKNCEIFDSNLLGGEESHLVAQLIKDGKKGFFVSDLFVWHARRDSFKELFLQMIKYGEGRGLLIRKFREFELFHLVPLIMMLMAGVIVCLGFSVFIFQVYLFVLGLACLNHCRIDHFRTSWAVFALSPVIHLGYAIGTLKGLLTNRSSD